MVPPGVLRPAVGQGLPGACSPAEEGRFRSFLLTGLKNLLCDEHDKASRLKRGGGNKLFFSFDAQALAEDRYRLEPADWHTPRSSSTNAVGPPHCWSGLPAAREYTRGGPGRCLRAIDRVPAGCDEPRAYAEVVAQLGLSQSAVKSAIHRLRQRHLQLVRDEIAQTVADPAEVDERSDTCWGSSAGKSPCLSRRS